jgi:hypothetical protein
MRDIETLRSSRKITVSSKSNDHINIMLVNMNMKTICKEKISYINKKIN